MNSMWRWAGEGGGRREGVQAGEERAGSRIPRSREPGEVFCNSNGTKSREPLLEGTRTVSKRYGIREVQTPPLVHFTEAFSFCRKRYSK